MKPDEGFDAARFDDADVDAEGLGLHTQRIAQCFEGVFRGMVPCTKVGGQPAADGSLVDDGAAVMGTHVGQYLIDEHGHAEDVHVELLACFLHAHVFHGTIGTVTGIVDEHVDAALGLDDGLHSLVDTLLVGHVEADGLHAEGLERLHLFYPAGCAIHCVALLG